MITLKLIYRLRNEKNRFIQGGNSMKYIQVGEIGKAVLVPTKSDLPTAGIAYLNKFYVATDTNLIYTCKPEGSGYEWKVAAALPTLTNGITSPTQLKEGVEAIDAEGRKVTGTMKFVEKTANANGTYNPADDNAQGYSKFIVDVAGSTAENPYIATTPSEMEAYLAEEYVGSFVRYENKKNRPGTISGFNTAGGSGAYEGLTNSNGRADFFNNSYLGQSRMNRYIDYLVDASEGNKQILKYIQNHYDSNITSTVTDMEAEIYAVKSIKNDGNVTRKLLVNLKLAGKNDVNNMPIYIDGGTADEMAYVDDFGWYSKGKRTTVSGYHILYDDIVAGKFTGVLAASYFISASNGNANSWYVKVQYKNSAVICRYNYSTLDSTPISKGELESGYQELGIYKICKVYQGSTIVYKAKLIFNGNLLENPWGNDPWGDMYVQSEQEHTFNKFFRDKTNEGSIFRFIYDKEITDRIIEQDLVLKLKPGKTYILTED